MSNNQIKELKDYLNEEIEWRIAELGIIKANTTIKNLSERRKEVIIKYSVMAIYSLFEGFVVKSFQEYINQINKKKIKRKELNIKLITYHIDSKYKLNDKRSNRSSKESFVTELNNFFCKEKIELDRKIATQSNVNMKVLNNLLYSFNLELIESNELEGKLNKLLKFRNSLAHGETSLRVDSEIIQTFTDTVVILMDLINDRIIDGIILEKYLA